MVFYVDLLSWVNALVVLIQDHDPVSVHILFGTKAPEQLFLPHLMKLLDCLIVLSFFRVAVGGVSVDGQVFVPRILYLLWLNMRVCIWIDWEELIISIRLLIEIAQAHGRVNERFVRHVEGSRDGLAGVDEAVAKYLPPFSGEVLEDLVRKVLLDEHPQENKESNEEAPEERRQVDCKLTIH